MLGQAKRSTCPHCGAFLIPGLPLGGKGQRRFQCLDCDRPDPLKTDKATGRLKGELQPPK
jgi:RNase P subunit RPR2